MSALAAAIKASMVAPRPEVRVGIIDNATGGAANPSVTVRGVTDEGSVQCGFTNTFKTTLTTQGQSLNGRSVLVVLADSQPFIIDLIGG